jgi:hypothetical protein
MATVPTYLKMPQTTLNEARDPRGGILKISAETTQPKNTVVLQCGSVRCVSFGRMGTEISRPKCDEMSKTQPKLPKAVRQHLGAWIVAVSATVIGGIVLAILGFGGGGSGASDNTHGPAWAYGERSDVQYTVENDRREGVWALTSPIMETFADRSSPPVNAARWIPNFKKVIVQCAREGTPYEVELNGSRFRWRWYGELENGSWFPLAGFQETSEDGAQHLVPC